MKKNFTLKSIFVILFLLCAVNMHAQDRTCGMLEYMEEQMQDPAFAKEYEKNQAKFKARLAEVLAQGEFSQRGATITIPVAVHFPTANEADRACLEALAQNQIDILNADYTATNADNSQWAAASAFYPGLALGSANISFCIAVSNHPVGLDPELIEGNPAVTIGYDFGGGNNADANWAGYMNFVIRPIGALGFSPLGGSISAGQAVTMDDNAFGSGAGCPGSGVVPQTPYNLGRTVTHELGHFYNLNHTFNGDGNGVCGVGGDGIADTPEVANSTYACPANGSVAGCAPGTSSLTMNYMDYVNDACMYMFTPQQMTIVDNYVATIASDFKPGVCTPATPSFVIAADNSEVLSCPTTDTEAVFTFSYTTILDFNETTTFSATGNPAGTTVTFNPTTRNTDGDFTMTIGNLQASAQGEYTITVTGTSASETKNVDVLLKNTCTTIVCESYDSPQNLDIAITDGSGGSPGQPVANHVINIPDMATIESMTVNVDVSHTYVSDLVLQLLHPDGTTFINLWEVECGSQNDLDVTFDDDAGAIMCAEPTVGTYAPSGSLSTFNGLEAQGDWTLFVADFFGGDTGVINDWSITICSEQALSTEEFAIEDFSIFPNPNKGEFTVKLNSASDSDINIDVFDIRGRRIFNNTYTNNADFNEVVRLNNVQSGMYLVTVSDGNKKTTKKIIIE